jgi:archaellum component FlaC
VTNGIFCDDAERDSVILRLEERLKAIQEDISELKSETKGLKLEIKEFKSCVEEVQRDHSQLKGWFGLFTAIIVPVVLLLFQRL